MEEKADSLSSLIFVINVVVSLVITINYNKTAKYHLQSEHSTRGKNGDLLKASSLIQEDDKGAISRFCTYICFIPLETTRWGQETCTSLPRGRVKLVEFTREQFRSTTEACRIRLVLSATKRGSLLMGILEPGYASHGHGEHKLFDGKSLILLCLHLQQCRRVVGWGPWLSTDCALAENTIPAGKKHP